MPDWNAHIRPRLASLRLSPTREAEIVDELSQHLDDRYAELIARGVLPEEAARAALSEFQPGNVLGQQLSSLRQAHARAALTIATPTGGVLADFWLDVRYGWRQFLKRPAFTTVVVGTLAMCLAANLAMFAVVDAVVLRPLPFPEPHRLVAIHNTYPGAGLDVAPSSARDFLDRQRLQALAGLAAYRRSGVTVGNGNTPERVIGLVTSPSLFALIGTRPFLGRLLLDSDAQIGAEQKVLLTHGYWRRAFGGRNSAVGDELRVNGVPFGVVGVLPPDWRFIDPDVEVVIPAAFSAQSLSIPQRHRNNNWRQIGRLAPGATLETLQGQIDALNAANLEETPEARQALANIGFSTRAVPFQRFVAGGAARTLYFLWGGVIVVLLVGAINVGNMMLVRAAARRREWATRLALGAGRGRLLRQSLIESGLLALAGGTAGLLLGAWMLTLAPLLGLDTMPRGTEIALDRRTLMFLVTMTLLIALALGTLPLLTSRFGAMMPALREEGRTGTASRAGRVARRLLASAQVAGALMLLVVGGVLLGSLQRVLSVDVGFRTGRLLTAQLNLPATRYTTAPELQALVDRLLDRLRQLPGAESAGIASTTPFSGPTSNNAVLAEGYRMAPGESMVTVQHVSVSDGYFDTIGARLIAGRWFTSGDGAGSRKVIIIDDRLARKFFPDGNAIGRRLWPLRSAERMLAPPPPEEMLTVVGVVAEVRLIDVVDDPGVRSNGACYYPYPQRTSRTPGIAVRTATDPARMAGAVRRAVGELDAELPLSNVDTVDNLIDRSLVDRRTPALVAAGFAVTALLLAMLGVYGVLAYQVSQRTRELGIRMALGADARRIFRLIVTEGAVIVGAGAAAGLVGAALASRTLESQVYGIGVMDPAVVSIVVSGLAMAALLAIVIPARRAARTDPAVALADP